ncbi:uncharacterized protein LOC116841369 [Odontomachus brunneus]|uniref:uncharacterized protein LOC116841369 n=1 Tax=Odontomachus brunneus TaxID=486640 RepID=UPI0013F2B135|nr:uncharacterized protein LOC116841369 [Odontomachus brunneus]
MLRASSSIEGHLGGIRKSERQKNSVTSAAKRHAFLRDDVRGRKRSACYSSSTLVFLNELPHRRIFVFALTNTDTWTVRVLFSRFVGSSFSAHNVPRLAFSERSKKRSTACTAVLPPFGETTATWRDVNPLRDSSANRRNEISYER